MLYFPGERKIIEDIHLRACIYQQFIKLKLKEENKQRKTKLHLQKKNQKICKKKIAK